MLSRCLLNAGTAMPQHYVIHRASYTHSEDAAQQQHRNLRGMDWPQVVQLQTYILNLEHHTTQRSLHSNASGDDTDVNHKCEIA